MSEQEKPPTFDERVGIITHDQAMNAAMALIDEHFHNVSERRVKTCIPVEPDDTDVVLTSYIRQQRESVAPDVDAEWLEGLAKWHDDIRERSVVLTRGQRRDISARLRAIAQRLPRWIPVSESPMKDGEYFVCIEWFSKGGVRHEDVRSDWWRDKEWRMHPRYVTHWTPLPAPPAECPSQKEGE